MAIPATFVRVLPPNPSLGELYGMAIVPNPQPSPQPSPQPFDPMELSRRLRDITPDLWPTADELQAEIVEIRNKIIALGGRPTRPIHQCKPEEVNPESVRLYDLEHGMYELYYTELDYWRAELKHWKKFLQWRVWDYRHRKMKQNNNASQHELPTACAMDKMELFREYLGFQQRALNRFDVKNANVDINQVQFREFDRSVIADRLEAIKRQLEDIIRENESDATLVHSSPGSTAFTSQDPGHSPPSHGSGKRSADDEELPSPATKRQKLEPSPQAMELSSTSKQAIGPASLSYQNQSDPKEVLPPQPSHLPHSTSDSQETLVEAEPASPRAKSRTTHSKRRSSQKETQNRPRPSTISTVSKASNKHSNTEGVIASSQQRRARRRREVGNQVLRRSSRIAAVYGKMDRFKYPTRLLQ